MPSYSHKTKILTNGFHVTLRQRNLPEIITFCFSEGMEIKSLGFSLLFQVGSYSSNAKVQTQTQLQFRTENHLPNSTSLCIQRQTKPWIALLSHNGFLILPPAAYQLNCPFLSDKSHCWADRIKQSDYLHRQFPQNPKNMDLISHFLASTNTECFPSVGWKTTTVTQFETQGNT